MPELITSGRHFLAIVIAEEFDRVQPLISKLRSLSLEFKDPLSIENVEEEDLLVFRRNL